MRELITSLLSAQAYRHPVKAVILAETHISWVLLTGEFAYKIKKPVNFGFLNFSSLQLRQQFCQRELEFNKILAPNLYLDVVKITGSEQNPQVEGEGKAIEYAVKMREFPQNQQLDRLLQSGGLNGEEIDQLANKVAHFHLQAEQNYSGEYGSASKIHKPVSENFKQILPYLTDNKLVQLVERIADWTELEFKKHIGTFERREAEGFIRTCHGDMHLRNMVMLDGQVLIFDCIEFSESLRRIDVISEAAFVYMDLHFRGRPDFAMRFINSYLSITGYYSGMGLLNFYAVYRAVVRAKVAILQSGQSEDATGLLQEFRKYITLASNFITERTPQLIITFGVSGTGKSTVSRMVAQHLPAVHIRSDIERKRLLGLSALSRTESQLGEGIYNKTITLQTYQQLAKTAHILLKEKWSVVVDATFLRRDHRTLFLNLASEYKVSLVILACSASDAEVRERITNRKIAGVDASEADLHILDAQIQHLEPLTAFEARHMIAIDSEADDYIQTLSQQIRTRKAGS